MATSQGLLREQRKRLATLQLEAKLRRLEARAERDRSAAELAERDTRVSEREAEIERLRIALDEAQATAAAAEQAAAEAERAQHDPWYRRNLAAPEEALPDTLPADMPRQSFESGRDEPRQRSAGSSTEDDR